MKIHRVKSVFRTRHSFTAALFFALFLPAHVALADATTVAGTVYSDEGATPLGSQTVRVAVDGIDFATTAESDPSTGAYSIANVPIFAGSIITVYLEDETADAVTVSVVEPSGLSAVHLYQDRVIVRSDYGSSITNANLGTGVVDAEADVYSLYSVSGGDLTVQDGKELLVWAGDTFAPGGAITVDDIDINGTITLGSNTATVSGTWDATGGGFTTTGETVFDSAGSDTIYSDGDAFYHLTFSGAGTWTLEDALDVNGNLLLTAGTLDAKSGENNPITLSGSWTTVDGTFTYRSGTVTLDGGDQTLTGTGSFFNLTKIVAVARTLYFAANMTHSVFGSLTLHGASSNLLSIAAGDIVTTGAEQMPLQAAWGGGSTTCSSGDYNMGYRFYTTTDGTITELGVLASTAGGDRTARLYACTNGGCTTGTVVASVTVAPVDTSTWSYAALSSPVAVTAGQEYIVAVRATSSFFCYKGYNTNPDVTSGDVVIMENRYISGSNNLPTSVIQNQMYGVADMIFIPQETITGTGKLLLDGAGSMSLEYLDVANNDATGGQTLVCLNADGCVDGGGTTNWSFEELISTTVSGTVYGDAGSTPLGSRTVRVAVNGTDFATTAESDPSTGAYSVANVPFSTGSVLTIYLEDETEDAVTVAVAAPYGATSINLYQDRVIVRAEYGSEITNANLSTGVVAAEADISAIYGVSDGDLTVQDGKALLVWSGDTYAPGGAVATHDLDINGTLASEEHAATVSGSWDASGGTRTGTGTVTFTGAGSETIVSNGSAFHDIVFDGSGTWTLEDALDVNGDLALNDGTLDAKSGENNPITLSGSWTTVDGTFTYRSGTVMLDGGDQTFTGTGSFFNLTKITSAARTLRFAANVTQSVFGSLTLRGAASNLLSIRTYNAEIIGAEQTPLQTAMGGGTAICGAGDYNMGYRFYPTTDGLITELGVQGDSGSRTVRLYQCTNGGCTTATEIASVAVTAAGTSSWAYEALDTPIAVTANQEYFVAERYTTYCYRTFYTSPDVTSGDIVIMENRYSYGTDTIPATVVESMMYGIADIIFQAQAIDTGTGKLVLDGGNMSLEYLDVANNDATGGQTLACPSDDGCVDSGGTTNWSFDALPPTGSGGTVQFFWLGL